MNLKKIADGQTAEVFSLHGKKVLKLFRPGYTFDDVQLEAEKCALAFKQGLPTPQVIELVKIDKRQGIVFDKCSGSTMLERLRFQPNDLKVMAEMLAELHIRIHKCSGKGLPSTHDSTGKKIDHATILDDTVRMHLQEKLAAISSGDSMCHGDFHPENVLLSDEGPVIIDWFDATMGLPVADLVRTILLIRFSKLPWDQEEVNAFKKYKASFLETYQERYLTLKPLPEQIIEQCFPIVAGARLSENAARGVAREVLVEIARKG